MHGDDDKVQDIDVLEDLYFRRRQLEAQTAVVGTFVDSNFNVSHLAFQHHVAAGARLSQPRFEDLVGTPPEPESRQIATRCSGQKIRNR